MPKIKFVQGKKELVCRSGIGFIELCNLHPEFPIQFGCRRGECGSCAIKILKGMENLTKESVLEMETLQKKGLDNRHRLACQCAVNGFVEIQ